MGYELQPYRIINGLMRPFVSIPVWGTSCNEFDGQRGIEALGFNPRMGYELQR